MGTPGPIRRPSIEVCARTVVVITDSLVIPASNPRLERHVGRAKLGEPVKGRGQSGGAPAMQLLF
eukprot:scaffold395_cov383-Prasinococcus_capsulatus_cf.AAC.18